MSDDKLLLTTSFPRRIAHYLKSMTHDPGEYLRYHQLLVREYMKKLPPGSKGVLLDHMMGEGKTLSSVGVAEWIRETRPSWRIVVVTNKSLAANYEKQLLGYVQRTQRVSRPTAMQIVGKNYRFVSMNASNMYERLMEQKLADLLHQEPSLENTILIMDEAQNFFNAVINGSKNALALYDRLLRTRNYIFFPMSGTPASKDVFSLVPCFNLLAGFSYLPENRSKFYEMFVDEEKGIPKNASHLQNFMTGKVSYFGPLYFPERAKSRKDFPRELPDVVEEVHMSTYQYSVYHAVRSEEKKEAGRRSGFSTSSGRFSSGSSASGSYRVRSRQASNFAFSKKMLDNIAEETAHLPNEQRWAVAAALRAAMPSKLTDKDLSDKGLEKHSPKLLRLLKNVKKHAGQQGMIYSSFVTGPGLAVISRVLDVWGYKGKYGFVTGSIDPTDRVKNIKEYNTGKIELLLISSAGAEGLNLKRTMHVHIFEPYWTYSRVEQVKARAVRYMSHSDMPVDEQTVQSYIYLSILPVGVKQRQRGKKNKDLGIVGEETTDEHMWNEALRNRKLIQEFDLLMARASVDCEANASRLGSSFECRDCLPTNKDLYTHDVEKDVNRPSSCKQPKDDNREEVEAKEVEFRGRKFWYVVDGKKKLSVFEYDPVLSEYVNVRANDLDLGDLVKEILKSGKL